MSWETNYSYYTVPAAYLAAYSMHFYAVTSSGKNFNMSIPRTTEDNCSKDEKMEPILLGKILRARGAHQNGNETIGLYAAGVVAANLAGVDKHALNKLSLAYLATRLFYNYSYVWLQEKSGFGGSRPLVWTASMAIIFTLFIKAGNAINANL
ncbi:hypothetical protein B0J13DRAFT_660002 [Dactylonectria estremocensis]|uniref:Uncharacterized protein n=1 Tax=Dactylonectria estremocensis TaxID=1079267 RepID=A0A9P9D142_9HYPO|nr:hypothetical protein B0J13DRAFT_660002 [Dactylonectria estremocensis]